MSDWNWIARYQQYCANNEAPDLFHYWCALTGLAHALGRRVWLDQFYFKIYPGQLMTVLVSPSALDRKTTAINMMGRFLGSLPDGRTNIIRDILSPRSLYESLEAPTGQDAIGLLVADELGTLLNKEKFAETLATIITDLNTADEGMKRRRMGSYTVELQNPCLGLLGGTTPKGLAKELPQAALQAGFLGRINLIFDDGAECKVNPLTEKPPEFLQLKAQLVKDLHRIATLVGAFQWDPQGKARYEAWYTTHARSASAMVDDLQTGWYGRKHVHLLRVAMVLSAARSSELILTEDVMAEAERAIEAVQLRTPSASAEIGGSPLAAIADRVLAALKRMGGDTTWIPHSKLAHQVWRFAPPSLLRDCLEALLEAEKILREKRAGGGFAYKAAPPEGVRPRLRAVEGD